MPKCVGNKLAFNLKHSPMYNTPWFGMFYTPYILLAKG